MSVKRKLEFFILGALALAGLVWAVATRHFADLHFKLDFLIDLSSLFTVASFSVRGILPLRLLAVVSQLLVIPYFIIQPTPLWTPVGWNALFMAINLYHITRILLERWPVSLAPDEQRLYELAFSTFTPREFLKLLRLGEWKNGRQGERILNQGDPINRIVVPITGSVSARQQEGELGRLEPGEIIGAGVALTGQASIITAEFSEDARYMSWALTDLFGFFVKNSELESKFKDIVNRFLVAQINKLALSVGIRQGTG